MREGISLTIQAQAKGLLNLRQGQVYLHEIDGVGGEGDEDNFHDEDIESFPAKEQIDVPGDKGDKEQLLGTIGQTQVR